MPRINLPIAQGFYNSASLPISHQECVNWFPNIPQTQGALSDAVLFGCSGLSELITSGPLNQINRGSHVKNGIPYFVNGTDLFRLDRTVEDEVEVFNLVNLGIIEGSKRVSMSDNGTQLIILNTEGKGYIVDESAVTEFQEINAAGFTANGTPQYVAFMNSFFVVTTDTKKFIRSDANNGLSWNALQFGTAEADPDAIVAPIVFKNQLFLGGSETFEVFNGVASAFGFQRVNGFIINKGLFAPNSLIATSDSFMFIGGGVNESPAVWALNGSTVSKVSTTAIDNLLSAATDEQLSAVFAYSYAQDGAYFVGFSGEGLTFEFNTVTQLWNERKSQIINTKGNAETIRWRANSVVTAYNKVLCGDSQDGRIGVLDRDTYGEYGRDIIRSISTAPFADQGNVMTCSALELTVESGVGDLVVTNPLIRLNWSDNGRTFNNEIPRAMGKIGEYARRCIWRRLGRIPRFRVFRFVMSDQVKPVIIKLEAQMRGYTIGS